MSLLKSLFKSKENTPDNVKSFNWHELSDKNTLTDLSESSNKKKIVIFKHSTRCGISRMVLKSFEKKWADNQNVDFYYLDLLNHRDISNALADIFEVIHQSPQIIVLEKGTLKAHASHYDILNIEL